MSIRIEVWGNYACFSRPEMKTERVSYDVMTPSPCQPAAENVLKLPGVVAGGGPLRQVKVTLLPQRGGGHMILQALTAYYEALLAH